jgi:hypothetical protein
MNWRLRKLFRPYVGGATLEHLWAERVERNIVCLVARVQNFDSLLRERNLREFGGAMDRFYSAAVEAGTATQGDIERFCGSTVLLNYYHADSNALDLELIGAAFRRLRDSLEADFGLRIGIGICGGTVWLDDLEHGSGLR